MSMPANTLSELDDYLIAHYGRLPNALFYHWGVMAAAMRWQTTGDPRFPAFIREQTGWYLQMIASKREARYSSCAAVEGLATAYRTLARQSGEEDPLMVRLKSRIELVMTRNRTLQIQPGQQSLLLDDGKEVRSPQLPRYAGAFLISSSEARTQIDVIGHCLSALVRVQNAGLAR
jgi:hypothetical protein